MIAGAIAKWYFLPVDAASGKKTTVPDGYVQGSLHRTCRYNLGSVAFGSFVLAVVKFIHACITYLEAKAKEIRGEPNAAEKVLMAIVHCCMTCVECCLDKISRNAYCWIAAWGGSFLGGSCGTFKLFLDSENMVRAAAMSYTSNILLFVGKTFVACFTTAVASAILSYAYTSLSSILLPTVLIFLFSMFVGEIFMLELEVAVDVIFLCFCVDLKTHNGSIKYGTSEIKSMFDQAVDDHKAQHMTQADRDEAAKKGSVQ